MENVQKRAKFKLTAKFLWNTDINMTIKTLTLTKLSAHLGCSKRALYYMIADGRFPVAPIKDLSPRRWNLEDVDAWRLASNNGVISDNL